MNDVFRDLKTRIRLLEEALARAGVAGNLDLAQALSHVRRAARRADRSRAPSAELQHLLARAEGLARSVS